MVSPLRLALLATLLPAAVAAANPPADLAPYRAFAAKVEQAVRTDDRKAYADLLDHDAFAERVFRDLKVPEAVRRGFSRPMGQAGPRLFGELARAVREGGDFKLLRVRLVGKEPRALFRVLPADGGVNYADFLLTPPGPRGPRAADADIALSGEPLSRTVGRMMAMLASELRGKEVGIEADDGLIANLAEVQRFVALARGNKPAEALAAWEKLPAALKREKLIALTRVVAASARLDDDPDGYRAAIDDFVKRFPRDPAVDLVSVDGHLIRKQYAAVYRTLDRLNEKVGGDPYLDVLRGNVLLLEGKPAAARWAARRAIAAEPDLVPAYFTLVDVALVRKDYREVARLLTQLETELGQQLADLESLEAYADFVKSPEYRRWQARRKAK